ncbi:pentapeptide repeat-containing protein [Puniceibacterium sediminis]|uniref:Uncharacterized protein YjbI, contains pentapeptide repeats n=1 Tax=Puniceibacterium sediminis TaxID=1608407 RepID=A0A238UZ38_9RHOB|nr:pentapeptide repeat-containing protein [Puniceibacterium sediminis]SNR27044.1 Uncharacterized protein YjbI, contains pentapeptide repeats [Puniceibacterium sediminis]
MTKTEITIPLPPDTVWGIATLLGAALAMGMVFLALLQMGRSGVNPLGRLPERLGLSALNPGLVIILITLWGLLFLTLTAGLFGLIFDILVHAVPDGGQTEDVWNWRFKLVQITALTGVLGAVTALPFTLVRIRLTATQNITAAESLFNDKINAATTDLYAQRQVTEDLADGTRFNRWEDDVIKRNAAIDRLEGLVEERPDTAPRIARMLSVYVRELSREMKPKEVPEGAGPGAVREWAQTLEPARSDLEKAVQTLGRLRRVSKRSAEEVPIDLRSTNLQGFELGRADFQEAEMSGAQMQGTDLSEAQLQGARLFRAQLQGANLSFAQMQGAGLGDAQLQGANLMVANMQGADLSETQLQGAALIRAKLQGAYLNWAQLQGANLMNAQLHGADLHEAQLQGASLYEAQLQGANLFGVDFDASTSLRATALRGAALRDVDCNVAPFLQDHINGAYGDASVILGKLAKPTHWDQGDEPLGLAAFEKAWRAHMRKLGMDPDDPK